MKSVFSHISQEWRDFCSFRYPCTSALLLLISVYILLEIVFFGLSPTSTQLLNIGAADGATLQNPIHWWRLISSNFLHSNLLHFFSVAIGLWYMNSRLEQRVGLWWVIGVTTAGCIGSSIVSLIYVHSVEVQVGASGIVAAACGAGLVVDWRARQRLGKMARWFLLSFGLYALIAQDHSTAAHLGGIVSGVIIGGLFQVSAWRRSLITY